ncbi:MAG: tetratricopeptide repeat protein [Elusimicrobia bacterium]|nr:tetratricopeptide repeat protein [Elusimicrobiota bacterium]
MVIPQPKSVLDLCRGGWRPYLCIASAGFLLYLRTLFFDFSYLDDNVLILDNQVFLRQLSNIIPAFRMDIFHILHSSAAYYRPLLTVSFILDAQWGGSSPGAYHLTNLLIHLCASCLVYRFLMALDYGEAAALFWALAFTVHPALTQAVAWIPGRNDSLVALFVLAAFLSLVSFLRTGSPSSALAHLLCFAFGLLTKESAVGLVPMGLFYWAASAKAGRRFRDGALLLSGWGVVLALWLALRQAALRNPIHMAIADMAVAVWRNLPAVIPSVGKMFLPFDLSVLPILRDMSFFYGFVAVAALAGALWASRKKSWPRVVFGLAWFLVFLLPSFIRPNPAIAADFLEHRLYLPMVGVIVLLCETSWLKARAAGLGGLVLAALALGAFVHSRNFEDRMAFWKNAAETSPHSPLAHRNLGAMYYLDGQPSLAEPEYRRALELNPRELMAHNNLGLICMERGLLPEAEKEFLQELAVNPSYDNAFLNLGILRYRQGRGAEAAALWKRALEINPNLLAARRNLAAYEQDRRGLSPRRGH